MLVWHLHVLGQRFARIRRRTQSVVSLKKILLPVSSKLPLHGLLISLGSGSKGKGAGRQREDGRLIGEVEKGRHLWTPIVWHIRDQNRCTPLTWEPQEHYSQKPTSVPVSLKTWGKFTPTTSCMVTISQASQQKTSLQNTVWLMEWVIVLFWNFWILAHSSQPKKFLCSLLVSGQLWEPIRESGCPCSAILAFTKIAGFSSFTLYKLS